MIRSRSGALLRAVSINPVELDGEFAVDDNNPVPIEFAEGQTVGGHPPFQRHVPAGGGTRGQGRVQVDPQRFGRRRSPADGDRDVPGECFGRGGPSSRLLFGPLLGEPAA